MRHAIPLVLVIVLVACDAYEASRLPSAYRGSAIPRAGRSGGSAGLGGSTPAAQGGSSAACVIVPETCNGHDDDCDTRIDENPVSLCALADAAASCTAGACAIVECNDAFVDCNGLTGDGCELAAAEVSCARCPTMCGEPDAGPSDAGIDPADAGSDAASSDAEAASESCLALTPSGRGADCDACMCERCAQAIDDCQGHDEAARAGLCSDVIDCYFENDAANCGGTSSGNCTDGYNGGSGPCAGELRLAAGGADENDAAAVNAGACSEAPANNACAAASAFATCREANCMAACM